MTEGIWGEKPKKFDKEWYAILDGHYDGDEMDVWLERLFCDYNTLKDYETRWLELRELLKGYLVDCNDPKIIFLELESWKEKAEKYDDAIEAVKALKERIDEIEQEYRNNLEAVKSWGKKWFPVFRQFAPIAKLEEILGSEE